jgi:hypothetical protein
MSSLKTHQSSLITNEVQDELPLHSAASENLNTRPKQPDVLAHLLDGVEDREEREQISDIFYRISAGTPDSLPVQSMLLFKRVSDEVAAIQNAITQLESSLTATIASSTSNSTRKPDDINWLQKVTPIQYLSFALCCIFLCCLTTFVYFDHTNIEKTITTEVALRTKDALFRLHSSGNLVPALTNLGISAELDYVYGNPFLTLRGRPGIVTIAKAQFDDGTVSLVLHR